MIQRRRKLSYTDQILKRKRFLAWLAAFFALYLAFELVSGFFLSSYAVATDSMLPGIAPGDRVLASPFAYGPKSPLYSGRFPGLGKPERGDLVLMEPSSWDSGGFFERLLDSIVRFVSFQQLGVLSGDKVSHDKTLLVKRVIAGPGDRVYMKDFVCYVETAGSDHFLTEYEVSGKLYDTRKDPLSSLHEPSMPFSGNHDAIILGEGEYYVVGDNRTVSADSRAWGTVKASQFVAKLVFRYWPFDKFGSF